MWRFGFPGVGQIVAIVIYTLHILVRDRRDGGQTYSLVLHPQESCEAAWH
jgi:hypothetical protein